MACPSKSCQIVQNPKAEEWHCLCRRHMNLLCLNIPGMLMSIGQPSMRRKAAQYVKVITHLITFPTLLSSAPVLVNQPDFCGAAGWHAKLQKRRCGGIREGV